MSSAWNGFLDRVKSKISTTDLVIFDVRGNSGGDESTGYMLSALFHKEDNFKNLLTPYAKQVTSQTPETLTLKMNSAKIGIRWDKEPKNYYQKWLVESENALTQVIAGQRPEIREVHEKTIDKSWRFNGHKLPIYILMDSRCASSCESSIDAFEMNPYVKKVGTNTSGTLHFGNITSLFLKNSKLNIQIPTHANFYRDNRFIEKVDIKPDITLPVGTDAFTFLKENILKK